MIYFIGIGGIGTSALAKYYFKKGERVLGSDLSPSEITEELQNLGIKIFLGKHQAKNLPKEVDLVIYSQAIEKGNPELKKARKLKIKCQSYPQALGEITKKYFTIAVSGTHGKSTTASLIGIILKEAKFFPTVIVGTKVKEFSNSNFLLGKGKYLVIEADEYKDAFLNYWPKIIGLTTLEPDHLDYFKNFENYKRSFLKFVSHLKEDGKLILNRDDKNIFSLFKNKKAIWYSLKDKEAKKIKKILKVPGSFNVSNALCALKVARILGIEDKISFKAISNFEGIWRRCQIEKKKIFQKKVIFIHDYAHHPTEVKLTLEGIREKFKKKKIIAVFQPHQYQRTYYLWNEFIEALRSSKVDQLILTKIYSVAGRESEKIKKIVSAKKMAKILKENGTNVVYLPEIKDVFFWLKKNLQGGEIVAFLGAGDIYQKVKEIENSGFLI